MMFLKRFFTEGTDFIQQLVVNRHLIYKLTNRDFRTKYIKNFFGLAWAILDPVAFIVIMYFVFGQRFGNKEALGVPYIFYLMAGYVAYDFFSTLLRSATSCIEDYSWILNKVNFRVAILPLVKILSSLQMHLIILFISCILFLSNHIAISFYWLQIIYYMIALSCFILGLTWFTSSVNMFFPDIQNIINIVIRLLFFLTPIFWNMEGLPESYRRILMINPLYYIVNGYRESFLYGVAFWKHWMLTLYFWGATGFFMVLGITVFRKLRPHFADVV
jgi:ABC-type polysaccharide/polyol phosphate export permease